MANDPLSPLDDLAYDLYIIGKLDGTTVMQHRAGASDKPLVLHAQHDPDADAKLFAGIISIVVLCVCATAWLLARYRHEANQKKTGGRFGTPGRE